MNKKTKLLLLSSSVFLLAEIERACRRLGVSCRHLALESEEMDLQKFVDLLSKEIRDFAPDALLTLNHSGVDREGHLFELLEKFQTPLVSWFVDNPHLLLSFYSGKHANNASSWLNIFTWDKDNISSLQKEGYANTYYLPLGTDAQRFHPNCKNVPDIPTEWKADISFVGTSMFHKVSERLIRSGFPQEYMHVFFDLGADFASSNERSIDTFIENQTDKKYQQLLEFYQNLPAKEAKFAFQAGLTWEATRVYRLSCVKQIFDFNPLIVGDDGWQLFFENEKRKWRWLDAINYYNGVHKFYTQSTINFNCTSMQMKGASNQRILDVPACGSFVLTDYREQMLDMFELSGKNQEMVCYHTLEEIPDLVRFYLKHDTERERIIQKGRERVLACHTWDHRVQEVINVLQEKYNTAPKNTNTLLFKERLNLSHSPSKEISPFESPKFSDSYTQNVPKSKDMGACLPNRDTASRAEKVSPQNEISSEFWQKVRKKRFQEEPKLLFIDTGHFLLSEISRACRRKGIKYKYLRLNNPTKGDTHFIEQLLKEALVFAPDAIFTFNSFGLDPEGHLTKLLEKMGIPLISWFVDNPANILTGYDSLKSHNTSIFTFDKDTIPALKAQGFDKVYYLPLATDITYFHPDCAKKTLPQALQEAFLFSAQKNKGKTLSFVGDSVSDELEKRFTHTYFDKTLFADFVAFGEGFATKQERSIQKYVLDTIARIKNTFDDQSQTHLTSYYELLQAFQASTSQDAKLSFYNGLTCAATKKYRKDCVAKILEFSPLIVGDEHWDTLLKQADKTKPSWILHPKVPYRQGLNQLYAHSTINFNTTSLQMKGAPNQRAFDVSASAAFILTDYREQLEDLFELSGKNQEIVCYHDIAEIPELVHFYLHHDTERDKVVKRALRRVIASHTWDLRLENMLNIMIKNA